MTASPSGPPSPSARRSRLTLRGTVPSDVAPGLDPAWAEAFVLELRLADVPGSAIGAALAEVASHCAESGETPEDAFGEPVAYARSLTLPTTPPPAPPSPVTAVPWVVQTLGLLGLATAAPSLVAGDPVDVTTGHVAAVVLLTAGLVALQRWGAQVLRLVVRHPVLAWLALMAQLGVMVAVFLLLDGVVAQVPAAGAMAVSAVVLVAGTVAVLAALRRVDLADDPVTTPLAPARPRAGVTAAALRYGPALLSPVAALVLVGTGLLLGG
ncbi:hypothetical protein [Cellulomonas aerilata]|uniref:Uncharacterized protein n=1 Tax=Cellulomonas aerilata TaxID=515326 RepID=A0A512D9C7_9CELL|nr:hypothetical protein [Cellulomonas aerilata]GEO33015.1 hypothetical protein CAE01nite_07400 [Cellulomonas aerilata]